MDQVSSPFVLLESNNTLQNSKQPSTKSSKTSKAKKQSQQKQKPVHPMVKASPPKSESKPKSPLIDQPATVSMDQYAALSMDQFLPLLIPPMEQALLPLESDTGIKPVFFHYSPPSFSSSEQPNSRI